MKRIFLDYSLNGLKNLDIIQSYFVALLCEVNSIYKPLSDSNQTTAITITNKFKQLVFSNIKAKHLVAEYASLLHITPNHLNKVVKSITGKSPAKWIVDALVLEAKILLHQTNMTISEVATDIGIYDQSYFSRLFKKQEGVTPLELHTSWDIVHHLYANPIVSLSPSSSAGCAVCDTILAIWFFYKAPSVFELVRKTAKA